MLVREEVSSIKEEDIEVFVVVMFAWISERVVRVRMCVFFAISYPTNKFDGSNYFLLFSLVSLSVRHSSSYSMDLRIISSFSCDNYAPSYVKKYAVGT